MKFPKGTIKEAAAQQETAGRATNEAHASALPDHPDTSDVEAKRSKPVIVIENDRLFETVEKESGSERKYLKLLGLLAASVIVGVGIFWYFMQPGQGDRIKGPKGLEAALRDHIAKVDKREATDIEFYNCGGRTWARISVIKRPDITTNPVYQLGRYTAWSSKRPDGSWQITTEPTADPESDVPCR